MTQQDNNEIRVAAGGGNSTDVKTVFIPQNIEIQAGQTLTWYNPDAGRRTTFCYFL